MSAFTPNPGHDEGCKGELVMPASFQGIKTRVARWLSAVAFWLLRRSLADAINIVSKEGKPITLFYDNGRTVPENPGCSMVPLGCAGVLNYPEDVPAAVISVTRGDSSALHRLMTILAQSPRIPFVLHYPSPALCFLLRFFCHGEALLATPGEHNGRARFRSNRGLACIESDTFDVYESISPLLITFFLCFFLTIMFLRGETLPLDDLARHSKAFLYNYDFRNLFVYSYHPAFNPYIGFDLIAGDLYRLFGRQSFLLFQLAPLLLSVAALRRLMRGSTDNMISLAVLVMFYFISERFLSGRPCVFTSSIFLCAYAHRDELPAVVHFLVGLVTGFLYYLFFLYTVPLILVGSRRQKVAYLLSTVCALVVWYVYSRGQFFTSILSLSTSFNLKHGTEYTELQQIIPGGLFAFLPVLLPFFLYGRRDRKRAFVAFYFILLDQLRFFETITPIAASFARYLPVRVGPLIVAAALSMALLHVHTERHETLALPAGSTVMAENSFEMNSVVMDSGKVKVAPSANIGWNDRAVRNAVEQMQADGTLDCSVFATHKFDYIVEHCLKKVPACLSLDRLEGPYRIWKVKPYFNVAGGIS
jgi:hypothetical protein